MGAVHGSVFGNGHPGGRRPSPACPLSCCLRGRCPRSEGPSGLGRPRRRRFVFLMSPPTRSLGNPDGRAASRVILSARPETRSAWNAPGSAARPHHGVRCRSWFFTVAGVGSCLAASVPVARGGLLRKEARPLVRSPAMELLSRYGIGRRFFDELLIPECSSGAGAGV